MRRLIITTAFIFCLSLIVLGQENEERSLFSVYVDGVCGYIDKTGKIVIRPRFKICGSFSEGLAYVMLKNRKVGFIDVTGKLAIKAQFSLLYIAAFSEGYATIYLDGKHGYVDHSGKIKLFPSYSYVGTFSEGHALIERDKLYGYIDKNFNVVIEPEFKYAQSFGDGLARVRDEK